MFWLRFSAPTSPSRAFLTPTRRRPALRCEIRVRNPTGNNLDITAALNGKNLRQVVFINPADGLRVNDRGELIDNWDTPFFFHQVSATVMEIYSAGPDRKMWTADDLMIK